jgi:hypothetical protein
VMEAGPAVDAGPTFAPDASFSSHPYFMSCLSSLAAGNVGEANNFVAHFSFTAMGKGGTVMFDNQSIVVGATSLSQTVGMDYSETGTVSADGTASLVFGSTTIPSAANPFNSGDVVFTDSTLSVIVQSPSRICGSLTGNIVMPSMLTIKDAPCIFIENPGSPLPTPTEADYHCP